MARITLFQNSPDAVEYPAGEVIFNQGDAAASMYVIQTGEVEVIVNGQVVDTAGPGETIGEMALIDRVPRSGTARARVDSTLVPVDERRFVFMVQETPYFALQVMSVLAERLRRHNGRIPG